MKTHLRNYVAAAMLLVPAMVTLSALPSSAIAQPATPEIRSLAVEVDAGLEPGSRLRIRLEGTPRVQASVRIRGVRETIALREVAPGVYAGRYTLKRADRVAPDSDVRAILKRGNRTVAANFELGETMGTPPVAAAPPPPVRAQDPLRIERFGMLPVDRIEPGAELKFALEGMPGANASVDLPGVERDLRLRETRPGVYEGAYTVRRADDFNPNRPIVATLRAGDREVTSSIAMPVGRPGADNRPPAGGDNRAPDLVQLMPAEGAVVPAGPPVLITATFEDRRGSGVDPASVRITVSGRNVTQEAQITRQSLSIRVALPPGRQTVDVTARDYAGNAVRKSWSFDVAAAAPVNVPIRILNHSNNGQVGSGPTLVQGHTVPNANVAVTVNAVTPMVNVSQELFSRTVQADANGNFAFTFSSQFPIPGTRYEVSMVSTRGNLRDDARLVLVQR
ncbi:MAG: hypothetical protein Q8R01_04985 [Ramlibacter sp.]|nr:hypothetical protein [Ramlibacter sp.]